MFTSYAVGTQLLAQYVPGSGPVLTIDVKTIDDPNRSDWNVIADSKGGDPNNILVIDAHLDAIYGAGMLDNASGSATILDIAQQLKNTNTRNKLRFIWFGGEELGLLGSDYYVNVNPPTDLQKIKFDLDADVTATPNYVAGVLDPKDGVNLFGRTPAPRCRRASLLPRRSRATTGSTTSTRSGRTTSSSRPTAPMPSCSRRRDPGERCPHRPGLLQARIRCRPLRGLRGQLRGHCAGGRWGLCGQPLPLVRQPQQQRPRGADVDVEDLCQHGRIHGL